MLSTMLTRLWHVRVFGVLQLTLARWRVWQDLSWRTRRGMNWRAVHFQRVRRDREVRFPCAMIERASLVVWPALLASF
jgi:hypothetical protein